MIFEGTKKSIFFGLGLTRAGVSSPDAYTIVKLANIFGITTDKLLLNKALIFRALFIYSRQMRAQLFFERDKRD